MDQKICDMLELNKAPMLAIEKYTVTAANTPARRLLGEDIVGRAAISLLPEHLMVRRAAKFTASACIKDQSFSADVQRSGDNLYISLSPIAMPDSPAGFVSDFLMSSLLTELSTLGISINNSLRELGKAPEAKLQTNLFIMNRNYFSLRRSLQNLQCAIQLRKKNLFVSRRSQDICQLCSELASTVESLEKHIGIKLNFSTPLPGLACNIDRDLIERVILNILCNSCSAMPDGGTINMRLEKRGDNACITIEDEGSGIPALTMSNIFTRYETPLTPENLRQGSTGGLGLFISQGIVQLHGGAIIIENPESGGTRVSILLPTDPSIIRFESGSFFSRGGGIDRVLTEFAPILDSSLYSRKYND